MLDYIVSDFEKARLLNDDPSIGAMVICDSSKQAKRMAEIFEAKYSRKVLPMDEPVPFDATTDDRLVAGGEAASFNVRRKQEREVNTAALILDHVGTKQTRKQQVEAFKDGKIDLLFVYDMLLTGFDARRLKKLYLGREIKAHNLLQALTRVNRTYRDFRYGYVVDFADIAAEFEKTNQAYFDELQSELGDELEHYSNLFKTEAEILSEIDQIQDALWHFDTRNAEVFSQQITQIDDRAKMQAIVKALTQARELYNVIRLSDRERKLFEALSAYKAEADEKISKNSQLLQNEDFAERELLRLAIQKLNKAHGFDFDHSSIKAINKMILKEYLDESQGKVPA
jgi:type I restriction enzyme R subunit